MKLIHLPLIILAALPLCSCRKDFVQDENGVTVKVRKAEEGSPALVRLEARGERLIHVSATPEREFADRNSLVVLPGGSATEFSVDRRADTVTCQLLP